MHFVTNVSAGPIPVLVTTCPVRENEQRSKEPVRSPSDIPNFQVLGRRRGKQTEPYIG